MSFIQFEKRLQWRQDPFLTLFDTTLHFWSPVRSYLRKFGNSFRELLHIDCSTCAKENLCVFG